MSSMMSPIHQDKGPQNLAETKKNFSINGIDQIMTPIKSYI
jgi:hypothetical protein